MGFDYLRGTPDGAWPQFALVGLRVGVHRNLNNISGADGVQAELQVQAQRRIEEGMVVAAARIGFEANLSAAKMHPEPLGDRLKIVALRLVEWVKSQLPGEYPVGTGEAVLRQQPRQHGTACRLSGLQAFGEGTVEDALPVPRRLAVCNAKGVV